MLFTATSERSNNRNVNVVSSHRVNDTLKACKNSPSVKVSYHTVVM